MDHKRKLRMLSTNIKPLHNTIQMVSTRMQRMVVGANLSRRRFRMWKLNPFCNHCRLFVVHPCGYDLDHIVPLWQGGHDTDDNCQLLCKECHSKKTSSEAKQR